MNDLNTQDSIIKFKKKLIENLPFTPNNAASKQFLLSLHIGDLIHIYDFWQQRLIKNCARTFITSSKVRNSIPYIRNKDKIRHIQHHVSIGSDINGYLSHQAHSATFDVDNFKQTHNFNAFRDQLLIAEGFYHLHLEEYPNRTNDVLIVHVTSSTFEIIQVADHSLFENDLLAMHKYQEYVDVFLLSKNPNGGFYMGGAGGGMQNLAGSSIQSTLNQIYATKILQNVEIINGGIEKYVKKLYQYKMGRTLQFVTPEWRMEGRQIVIYDKKNKEQFAESDLNHRFNEIQERKF